MTRARKHAAATRAKQKRAERKARQANRGRFNTLSGEQKHCAAKMACKQEGSQMRAQWANANANVFSSMAQSIGANPQHKSIAEPGKLAPPSIRKFTQAWKPEQKTVESEKLKVESGEAA